MVVADRPVGWPSLSSHVVSLTQRAPASRATSSGSAERNFGGGGHWTQLLRELDARLVLVEFKNYDTEDIGKDEVNQTSNYLRRPMGRLAILVTNKAPGDAAHIKRNTIYSEDRKVILFVTTQQLIEMLDIKERGEDPADLIMDAVERFYLQHE
jgi:hypothetical protein